MMNTDIKARHNRKIRIAIRVVVVGVAIIAIYLTGRGPTAYATGRGWPYARKIDSKLYLPVDRLFRRTPLSSAWRSYRLYFYGLGEDDHYRYDEWWNQK